MIESKLSVSRYTPEICGEWNCFLQKAKNASFLFDRNYMDYHADRFRDFSLVCRNENGAVLAMMPANQSADNVVVSHQGLTYGGLVVSRDEKLKDMVILFKEILRYYQDNGIDKIVYKEIPAIYNDVPSDEMQYLLFILEARLVRRDACAVIRNASRFPYQRRRSSAIKHARALGVEIRQDNDFEAFWSQILEPNLMNRHGVRPVHSVAEIQMLHNRFPDQIKQFNAYFQGKIMAGVTIFEMDRLARAQYTSGSAEGRKNGSLDLLFDTLINHVYSHKDYIDFGNSNEDNGHVLNLGLLDWKEGLGARTYAQNFYEIQTANYTLLDKLLINRPG